MTSSKGKQRVGRDDEFWGESEAEKEIPYYEERNRRMNAYLDSKKNEIYPPLKQGDKPTGKMFRFCSSSDMHPYECDHDERCIHCSKKKTPVHNPKSCGLCNYEMY